MTKEEIIKYVMDTPGNTNPNVLKGMLENINTGGNNDPLGIEVYYDEDNNVYKWRGVTFTEIEDAVDAGRIVYLMRGDFPYFLCNGDARDAGKPNFAFSGIAMVDEFGGNVEIDLVRLYNDYTAETFGIALNGQVV